MNNMHIDKKEQKKIDKQFFVLLLIVVIFLIILIAVSKLATIIPNNIKIVIGLLFIIFIIYDILHKLRKEGSSRICRKSDSNVDKSEE